MFVAKNGRSELTTTILTAQQLDDLVERMLRASGRRLDVSQPFVDATMPDGSRLHVVIPDITRRHLALNIRKFILRAGSIDELVGLGSLPASAARFLEAAVAAGLNVVVAGGTQAGKTTMLNALAAAVPARERVITCEEVFELRLSSPDWVAMQTRQPSLEGTGEVPLRRLVKEALRMRPDRLIVGEVRQSEALDLSTGNDCSSYCPARSRLLADAGTPQRSTLNVRHRADQPPRASRSRRPCGLKSRHPGPSPRVAVGRSSGGHRRSPSRQVGAPCRRTLAGTAAFTYDVMTKKIAGDWYANRGNALAIGQQTCKAFDSGQTYTQMLNESLPKDPNAQPNSDDVGAFIQVSVATLCPQDQDKVSNPK